MICDILGYVNNGDMGIYAGLVDRKMSFVAFFSYEYQLAASPHVASAVFMVALVVK